MRLHPNALLLSTALVLSPVSPLLADVLPPEQIQTLVNQADALMKQNQYEPALALLQQAYTAAGSPDAAPVARNVLNSLANLYYGTGDLEAASRYYRELTELDTAANDRSGLSVSLFNLAHALADQGKYEEAAERFSEALQLSREIGDAEGVAFTLKAMAVNAQAQGDLVLAAGLLGEAQQQFDAIGNMEQRATVQRHLGDVLLATGDAAAAVTQYEQALPALQVSVFNSALLHTWRGLSAAYEQVGRFDAALEAQRAYTDLMQYDLEQRNVENTQKLQAQFETQLYASENVRLQDIRVQQEQQLAEHRHMLKLQFMVLALGALCVVLLMVLLLRSRAASRRMQHLATTDELTQLLNRRAVMARGKDELQRAVRYQQAFSCLMFDADHFKSINDTFGHATGDAVLKAIAAVLQGLLRQSDAIGRVGGEEFLLLAPGTDRLQAMALAERIRAGIEACKVEGLDGRRLSVSIGVAGLQGETTIDELIQHADQALYIAKSSGRNRCILYHDKKPAQPKPAAAAPESLVQY